jgi:hypothetical protein
MILANSNSPPRIMIAIREILNAISENMTELRPINP